VILRDKGVFCVHPKLSLDKFRSVLVCFLLDDGQVRHSERSDVVSNSARESADCRAINSCFEGGSICRIVYVRSRFRTPEIRDCGDCTECWFAIYHPEIGDFTENSGPEIRDWREIFRYI
jgi:hypothetical protein